MTVWASASAHRRTCAPAPEWSRRCGCGCNGPATHIGEANGMGLTYGCHWFVRRWVRDPVAVVAARAGRGEQ